MKDLIERDAAIEALGECPYNWNDDPEEIQAVNDWEDMRTKLEKLPAVEAFPVKHARWKDNGNGTVSCSRCSTWFQKEREPYLLFCGYCGARMDGDAK